MHEGEIGYSKVLSKGSFFFLLLLTFNHKLRLTIILCSQLDFFFTVVRGAAIEQKRVIFVVVVAVVEKYL